VPKGSRRAYGTGDQLLQKEPQVQSKVDGQLARVGAGVGDRGLKQQPLPTTETFEV